LLLFFADLFLQIFLRNLDIGRENPGVGLGFFAGIESLWIFLALFALIYFFRRQILKRNWAILLFVTGALVNLISRIIFGGVWDYINLVGIWINGADIMISAGVIGMIWQRYDKKF